MADDGFVDGLGRDWLWAERHFEDTGRAIVDDATPALNWTGRQLAWVGSGISQTGVEVIGLADRNLTPFYVPGHYYDTVIPMGTFPNVTPAMLLDAVRNNPKSFPISADKVFELHAVVTLSFFGTRNPVIVEKIDISDPDRASMLLRTQVGHFFQGTAEHIVIRKPGNILAWEVIGHGPDRELWDRYVMNMGFGRDEWPSLVRERVVPLAKKLNGDM